MWNVVRGAAQDSGVTIILTTHYIEEAEEMADRIGVINNGELILVEEKTALMRKLGKKQLTLQLHAPLDVVPGVARATSRSSCTPTGTSSSTPSTRAASARASPTLLAALGDAGIRFKDLHDDAELARGDLREPRAGDAHELARHPRDLSLRDGAHVPHARAEHRGAGDLDVAVLRRVRLGDRLADPGGRRHELRRVHRARPHHAVAADGEHRQRLVRHLLPALRGHDLRGAVGAGVGRRGHSAATSARRRRSR